MPNLYGDFSGRNRYGDFGKDLYLNRGGYASVFAIDVGNRVLWTYDTGGDANGICVDSNGNVFVGGYGYVFVLDPKSGQLINKIPIPVVSSVHVWDQGETVPDSNCGAGITALAFNNRGDLFVGGHGTSSTAKVKGNFVGSYRMNGGTVPSGLNWAYNLSAYGACAGGDSGQGFVVTDYYNPPHDSGGNYTALFNEEGAVQWTNGTNAQTIGNTGGTNLSAYSAFTVMLAPDGNPVIFNLSGNHNLTVAAAKLSMSDGSLVKSYSGFCSSGLVNPDGSLYVGGERANTPGKLYNSAGTIIRSDTSLEPYNANIFGFAQDGNYYITTETEKSIVKLDKDTGDILWSWGPGKSGEFVAAGPDNIVYLTHTRISSWPTDAS